MDVLSGLVFLMSLLAFLFDSKDSVTEEKGQSLKKLATLAHGLIVLTGFVNACGGSLCMLCGIVA